MERHLVVLSFSHQPGKDAGAIRILEMVRHISNEFSKIDILCRQECEEFSISKYSEKINFVPYSNIKKEESIIYKFKKLFNPTKEIMKFLSEENNRNKITDILIYSNFSQATIKAVRKFSEINGIQLIFDIVEEQSLVDQNIGSYLTYMRNSKYIESHINRKDKVITISNYLFEKYSKKSDFVYKIPLFYNVECVKFYPQKNEIFKDKLVLMYAGNAKRNKDNVKAFVEALANLDDGMRQKVVLLLVGVTSSDLINKMGLSLSDFEKTIDRVIYFGKQDHTFVEQLYQYVDFTCLLRNPKSISSLSGFSTKVSESLANGVPVMCNISGDLGEFLIDGKNSLICKLNSAIELSNTIKRALSLTNDDFRKLRLEARKTSEDKLNIKNLYVNL